MKIIYADDNLKLKNSVVVLGNFDGVHSAHKMLIEKAVKIAKEKDLLSVVYTFSEHPQKFFGKNVEILTSNSEKEKIFTDLGIDMLVYQQPCESFLNLSPEEFVEKTVAQKLGAKYIVVGRHYSFGAKAKGTSAFLKSYAEQFGIETNVEDLFEQDGQIVSSSNIREFLKNGDISNANKMLGRPFSINGLVVHGNHLGTGIGFPTANLNFDSDKIVPKFGVYAGKTIIEGTEYNSIINIGIKPTVGGNTPLLEAHIIGAEGDFYGKKMSFNLLGFLREERKFDGLTELKKQIQIDLRNAKEYFK